MNFETKESLQTLMKNTQNIRNISVIAHIDHGKSTLSDSLVSKAGLLNQQRAGSERTLDTMKEEQEQGITIKSTGITLFLPYQSKVEEKLEENVIINLIDSPGHIDFSSEVTAALRVTDGALVVLDTIEGVCVQTETVLRQACAERIKSCLFINKIDRAIAELQMEPEQIYQTLVAHIEKVNIVLSTYLQEELQEQLLDPIVGNVGFGAGKECWGFRLQNFALFYSKKLKCSFEKMLQRLWGDNFYDPKEKVWKKVSVDAEGKPLKRAFVQLILEPIIQIYKLIEQKQYKLVIQLMSNMGVSLTKEQQEQQGKEFRKTIMSQWLNVADSIVDMVVEHLPSPKEAMKYRTEILYDGPQDDEIALCMKNQDLEGPLIMYVSKMVPNNNYSRFYAFGRVFGGTLKQGKVIILGDNFEKGRKDDYYEKNIGTPIIMMGRTTETISEVPCGNTCALMGLDSFIKKTATITTASDPSPLRTMKFSVSPVVRVAVTTKKQQDLQKLIEGLRKLQQFDPMVQCISDDNTGEYIICGCGELHIQICLKILEEQFAKCELVVTQPIVNYKETVENINPSQVLFTKSSNKHNKLWGTAQGINEDQLKFFETTQLLPTTVDFQNELVETFQWDRDLTKKIWCFQPQKENSNVLVDSTSQVQRFNTIKDSIISGFEWVCNEGILTQENVRGYRFNLTDAQVHSDNAHRGTGQIMPMARRILQAGQLACKPRLYEPIFMCEIQVPLSVKGEVYNLLNKRRGEIFDEELIQNTPLCLLKSYLPVAESFGFTGALRAATSGQAFNQCVFDHWNLLPGDPFVQGNLSYDVVKQIRQRKGLKIELPDISDYIDKN